MEENSEQKSVLRVLVNSNLASNLFQGKADGNFHTHTKEKLQVPFMMTTKFRQNVLGYADPQKPVTEPLVGHA